MSRFDDAVRAVLRGKTVAQVRSEAAEARESSSRQNDAAKRAMAAKPSTAEGIADASHRYGLWGSAR